MFAGERWSARLFAPLAGRIVGCNLQSLEVGRGDAKLRLLDGTERAYQRVPAEQNTQADFPGFFAALRTVGYDGFVNVIEPADPARSVEDVASSTAECLRKAIRP
jgi:sugar phosphate isomerase/epimerase